MRLLVNHVPGQLFQIPRQPRSASNKRGLLFLRKSKTVWEKDQLSIRGHDRGADGFCSSRESKMSKSAFLSTTFLNLLAVFLCLFIIIPAPSTNAQLQSWRQSRPALSEYRLTSKRQCSIMCQNHPVNHVCGSDMKTYNNECRLRYSRLCLGRTQLKVLYKGRCTFGKRRHRLRTCRRRRMEMMQLHRKFPNRARNSGSYIPVCRDDGTFKKIQCHAGQNICFCVDRRTGVIKSNTARHHPKRPKCGGFRKKKGRVDKCNQKLRKQFNDNLIHQFKIEFDRVVKRRKSQRVNSQVKRNTPVYPVGMLITGEQGYTLNSTELRVVEWKFSELDLDHDNALSFRELRSLRRVVRRVVRPQACARRFAKRCDANKNRKIERTEWSACMGINTASFINDYAHQNNKPTEHHIAPASIIGLMNRKKSDKPFHRSQNCLKAHQEAVQKNLEEPHVKVFVPQCTLDGAYKRKQCYDVTGGEKLCFCMDSKGGVVKGETSNDCRQIKPTRQFKGCPINRKKRFLTELMDRMVEDTKGRWSDPHGPVGVMDISLVERALRWKFFLLDINRNGKLDKKEMRKFKEEIKRNVHQSKRQVARELRKCARNFVRYCDGDGDRSITLDELMHCTNIKKKTRPARMPTLNFLSLKTS